MNGRKSPIKDITGKPIYEGDIIKHRNCRCVVCYEHGLWYATDGNLVVSSHGIEKSVACNNIYDNPQDIDMQKVRAVDIRHYGRR